MSAQLMAIVAEGNRGRVYLPPTDEHDRIAHMALPPDDVPETDLPEQALGFRVQGYGMVKHRQLFTDRQLVALCALSDLVTEARKRVLSDGGTREYGDAVATYLAFGVDKMADTNSMVCTWQTDPPRLRATFARQAIPMGAARSE
jgi:putative DNA methylase